MKVEKNSVGVSNKGRTSYLYVTALLISVIAFGASSSEYLARDRLLENIDMALAETAANVLAIIENRHTGMNDNAIDSTLSSEIRDKRVFQGLRRRIILLMSQGAVSQNQLLPSVRHDFESVFTAETTSKIPMNVDQWELSWAHLGVLQLRTILLGAATSNTLLLVVVIFSGIAGSVISGLRVQKGSLLLSIGLGMSSGFITILAIMGGKHIFLMDPNVNASIFNPYSCAFLGLLTGLFTEKTFRLLSALFDELFNRLSASAGNNNGA